MRTVHSLDGLISKKAIKFANDMKAVAASADKEEEIRIAVEKQLAFIEKEAEITLEGKHEFTLASGRVDSVYDRVIIEYKNPCSPSDRIGPKASSTGSKKVVEQIKKRFYDMRAQYEHPLNTLFGVGFDGNYFIFIRFRDDKWQLQDPVELNHYSAERFLWVLFNLGKKGKPFSPDYLADDFGSEAKLSQDSIYALYNAIVTTKNPKAQVFFSQWKILFGEVCGYDVDNPSDKIKNLAESYGIQLKGLRPAELLFALHTYYAIFMKLLASQIVTYSRDLPTPLQNMIKASTSNKLRREMEDLEAGSIFRHLNITNFLEGDLFAWYTSVWSEPIEELVRNMVTKLDNYNPGTLSEDPFVSRDLLKKLYQQLFPKSVRHDLGEYYTPDWLAEHVLNELDYIGNPDKRLLDPACGSGTFLVMAINRIRKWYDENRENCRFGEDDLCRKILANVVGFDLNPLAVMAARTNYLIAIRDLITYVDKVEIPVYMCDSIMTPSEYGGLFAGALGKVKELKTAAANFLIPTEIATKREDIAKYVEQLEFCVFNSYSPKEFIQRCRDEGLSIEAESLHTDIYNELVKLDKSNKNGIWARIIKNAFAPLFIDKADYIAGNPPWVNWESLPEEYRDDMKPLWQRYNLFTLSGSAGRLGGGKKDICMLFVYSGLDNYLKNGGRLGFVINQTVFKTKGAGDGFRQLRFESNDETVVIKPVVVHDLSKMQVFEGATNRTAVFVCEKQNKDFKYPVLYVSWSGPSRINQDEVLESVLKITSRYKLGALPVEPQEPNSPWLTAPKKTLGGIQKVIGESAYKAHEGVNTGGLNGCFWINIIERLKDGKLFIENFSDVGKKKVEQVQTVIESDLVYPLLRGRDVSRWHAEPSTYIILSQDPETRQGIPETEMKRKYPKTFSYFKKFEEQLRKRASSSVRRLMERGAFYSMFGVGSYTFAPWKVIWKHTGVQDSMRACTISSEAIPDQKVILVSSESEAAAHFFCACINSLPAFSVIKNYIGLDASPHVLDYVSIPTFRENNPIHRHLSELSRRCHQAAISGDEKIISNIEAEIDKTAAKLWGITVDELKAIQDALLKKELNTND